MADDPANDDPAPPSREDAARPSQGEDTALRSRENTGQAGRRLWPAARLLAVRAARACSWARRFVAPCAVIARERLLHREGRRAAHDADAEREQRQQRRAAVWTPQLADSGRAWQWHAGNTPAPREGPDRRASHREDEGSDEAPSSSGSPAKPAPPKHFATVQDAAAGSCSTESVDGLSRQIIEQARCIKPNDFVALPKRPNLVLAAHVFSVSGSRGSRSSLVKALDAHRNAKMTVNSCLRTVAQQYLCRIGRVRVAGCSSGNRVRAIRSWHGLGYRRSLESGGPRWRPKTSNGWALRIACTSTTRARARLLYCDRRARVPKALEPQSPR